MANLYLPDTMLRDDEESQMDQYSRQRQSERDSQLAAVDQEIAAQPAAAPQTTQTSVGAGSSLTLSDWQSAQPAAPTAPVAAPVAQPVGDVAVDRPTTPSAPTVSTPGVGSPARDLVPDQMNSGLAYDDALAACGPAAAIAFARLYGRNPTLGEAVQLARSVGWSPQQGMAGPQSELALLYKMADQFNIPELKGARLEQGVNWDSIKRDVSQGKPVIIDTPGHYFVVSGYNAQTGQYYFGNSGTVYRRGAAWMSPQQMESVGAGSARAALYLNAAPPDGVAVSGPATSPSNGPSSPSAPSSSAPRGVDTFARPELPGMAGIGNALGAAGSAVGSTVGPSAGSIVKSVLDKGDEIRGRFEQLKQEHPEILGTSGDAGIGRVGSFLANRSHDVAEGAALPFNLTGTVADERNRRLQLPWQQLQATLKQWGPDSPQGAAAERVFNNAVLNVDADINKDRKGFAQSSDAYEPVVGAAGLALGAATGGVGLESSTAAKAAASLVDPLGTALGLGGQAVLEGGAKLAGKAVNAVRDMRTTAQFDNLAGDLASARSNRFASMMTGPASEEPLSYPVGDVRKAVEAADGQPVSPKNLNGTAFLDPDGHIYQIPDWQEHTSFFRQALKKLGDEPSSGLDTVKRWEDMGWLRIASDQGGTYVETAGPVTEAQANTMRAINATHPTTPFQYDLKEGGYLAGHGSGYDEWLSRVEVAPQETATADIGKTPLPIEEGMPPTGIPTQQEAQAIPQFAGDLAGATAGAAAAQVPGTDENTTPAERIARGIGGAALGLGAARLAPTAAEGLFGKDFRDTAVAPMAFRPQFTVDAEKRLKYIEQTLGQQRADQAVQRYQDLLNTGANNAQVEQFWKRAAAPPASWHNADDWFRAVGYNSMLSGIPSVTMQVLSNMFELPWATGRDLAGAALNGRLMSTAKAEAYGAAAGLHAGLQRAGDVLKYGLPEAKPSDYQKAFVSDLPGVAGRIGKVLEAPGRAFSTVDEFFTALRQNMVTGQLAAKEATRKGLSGSDWEQFVMNTIQNPPQDMLRASYEAGQRFALKGDMGNLGNAIQHVQNLPFAGSWLAPFVKTVYNLGARGVDRSPLGFVGTGIDVARGVYRQSELPSHIVPLKERLGDNALGTLLTGWFVNEALNGNITGSGPRDADERSSLERQGWQSDSVRLPDGTWTQYSNFGTVAVPLAIAGNLADALKYKEADADGGATITDMITRTGHALEQQSFLRSTLDLANALTNVGREDITRSASKVAGNLIASRVPLGSLGRNVGMAQDPYKRDPETVPERVISSVSPVMNGPIGRNTVAPQIDPYGQNVPAGATGAEALTSFRVSPVTNRATNLLDRELVRLRIPLRDPPKEILGNKLTKQQYEDYRRKLGPALQSALADEIRAPGWNQMSDDEQIKVIRKAEDYARKDIQYDMFEPVAQDERQRKRRPRDRGNLDEYGVPNAR